MVRQSASRGVPQWAQIVQKGSSSDSLHKRLHTLRATLSKAEQDQFPQSILEAIRTDLLHDDIMFHKLKEVRVMSACGHAEILRLSAPDCPYNPQEVLKLFQFFLSILMSSNSGLFNPQSSTFADCVSLLSSLVNSRSFAVLCEHGKQGSKIIVEYFEKSFKLIKPETQKNVEILLSEALTIMLQYCSTIPSKVINLLLENLTSKINRSNSQAHHLAEVICNGAADELQSTIAQRFADELKQAMENDETEKGEEALYSTHAHFTHIHQYAPAVLCNVVPQIEEELLSSELKIRCIAVETLGIIFSHRIRGTVTSTPSRLYPSAWKIWLTRHHDKYTAVRMSWVDCLGRIIGNDADTTAEILPYIELLINDPEEKVRIAMLGIITSLPKPIIRQYIPRSILQALGERLCDKRQNVFAFAIDSLGKLFASAYSQMDDDEGISKYLFGWIPNAILRAYNADISRVIYIRYAFTKYILPLPNYSIGELESHYTSRLFKVLCLLDDEFFNAFTVIANLAGQQDIYYNFLNASKRFNGGVVEAANSTKISKSLLHWIQSIARFFKDPLKAGQDLHEFAKRNDNRTYKLIETLMDVTSSFNNLVKTRSELVKRLEKEQGGSTVMHFVDMAAFPIINAGCVPALLYSNNNHAQSLLHFITKQRPAMLSSHIGLLKESIRNDSEEFGQIRATSLMALAKLQTTITEFDFEEKEIDSIGKILYSGMPNETKWAAALLSTISTKVGTKNFDHAFQTLEKYCKNSYSLIDSSSISNPDMFASILALQKVVKLARGATEVKEINTFELVVGILMKPYLPPENITETCDWMEEEQVDFDLRIRLASLRFITSRFIAFADHEDALEKYAKPTLKLLFTCLTNGEPANNLYHCTAAKARMRLEASLQILKLARNSNCDKYLGVIEFNLLATTLQDELYHVRHGFLSKLSKEVNKKDNLPARYYTLLFMVAFDPEEDMRDLVRNRCARLINIMKPEDRFRYFDINLARLLHILNHHPDFERKLDGKAGLSIELLEEASRYLIFYLECCSSSQNFSCLYHIANRCKGIRDAMDEVIRSSKEGQICGTDSKGLQILSELAMILIKQRAELQHEVVGVWNGQVALPKALFLPFTSRTEMVKAQHANLIDPILAKRFSMHIRRDHPRKRKGGAGAGVNAETLAKDVEEAGQKLQKKKQRRSNAQKSDVDEDDDEEEDVDVDEQEGEMSVDQPVSEDESVEATDEEVEEGRGARNRARIRKEKRKRNEDRRIRRERQEKK